MRVLLLHPEDKFPSKQYRDWDLIVDLGRAPAATYDAWSNQARCRVVGLANYARGFDDFYQLKRTLHHGRGMAVDKLGIDWWEVILPLLSTRLERCFMLLALAKELGNAVQLYSSRPNEYAAALSKLLGIECLVLEGGPSAFSRKVQHYRHVFAHLDFDQLTQIAQDKFDPEHAIRRRFARKKTGKGFPIFLLPTAYINVSRTAVSYASLLPKEQFLLVVARPGGKLQSLPSNVHMSSLDAYFEPTSKVELSALLDQWGKLQNQLAALAPEFRLADAFGVFRYGSEVIRWGVAVRDAWVRLFESEHIAGCLSADDVNPYTSLPILLAKQRGIPALAMHHGALDCRMTVKEVSADFYLTKGELEQDYLLNMCHADPAKITLLGAPRVPAKMVGVIEEKPWLVFFTEPYHALGWRMREVYEELLPPLCSLAKRCGLKLVFKLHPFESIKGHRNLVRKLVTQDQLLSFRWIVGPTREELWNKTRFALTVESTVALECAARGTPIFLCAWLQNSHRGYLQQYAKFGVGHILNSPSEMQDVPRILENWKEPLQEKIWKTVEPAELHRLFVKQRPGLAPTNFANVFASQKA